MPKRDNAYFERRLQRDHPATYADWKAGKFKSLTEARYSVGLGKPRTRLQILINTWDKASMQEQADFLNHLRSQGIHCASAPPPAPPPVVSVTSSGGASGGSGLGYQVAINGSLTPQAKNRILEIADRRGLIGQLNRPKYGVIMQEMTPPFKPRNMALARAVSNGDRLKPVLVKALERWLHDNRSV